MFHGGRDCVWLVTRDSTLSYSVLDIYPTFNTYFLNECMCFPSKPMGWLQLRFLLVRLNWLQFNTVFAWFCEEVPTIFFFTLHQFQIPTPQPQQCGIQATSVTYTTAHGNAGSLTHRARPGIKPATSWFLVRFFNHCATTGTPRNINILIQGTIDWD